MEKQSDISDKFFKNPIAILVDTGHSSNHHLQATVLSKIKLQTVYAYEFRGRHS